jgi:hypothetical protein
MSTFLDRIQQGRTPQPPRLLLYGTEGIGKTTFGASLPSPIFIDAEGGSAHVATSRFPHLPTYSEVMGAIVELYHENHNYKTLVIDTIDWLEELVSQETIRRHPTTSKGKRVAHLRDYGWGDGYQYALGIWKELLDGLDALRHQKGMIICLLAHYQIKRISAPDVDDYDVYTLKLSNKAVSDVVVQWVDALLFAKDKIATRVTEDRNRAVNTGQRVLYTTRKATHDAKNRFDLPEEIPFDQQAWATLSNHIATYYRSN